jgi:hypothetical protein
MHFNLDAEDLFSKHDLPEFLADHFSAPAVAERVNKLAKERFVESSDEDMFRYFTEMLSIEPLVLDENQIVSEEPREIRVRVRGRQDHDDGDVTGVHLKVSVRYTGLYELWHMAPHDSWSMTTQAEISQDEDGVGGWVRFDLEQPVNDPPERLQAQLDRHLHIVRETLVAQKSAIAVAMSRIPEYVRAAVAERRKALGIHEHIKATLKIQFAPRSSAPQPSPIPLAKKLLHLPSPSANQEWGIADEDYEYILKVLRHVGATFERTRRTYNVHDEGELRDILLAHLNGHLYGAAKAEAFSNRGKTDILVEYENRAAFIAECKIWHGAKKFVEAISQLFAYTTWRDYKTSLIVFNKVNYSFTDVRETIISTLRKHPAFVGEIPSHRGGEWRVQLTSPDDPAARITLHVFAFDLHTSSVTEKAGVGSGKST